jgi:hypothetical protein
MPTHLIKYAPAVLFNIAKRKGRGGETKYGEEYSPLKYWVRRQTGLRLVNTVSMPIPHFPY